MSVRTWLIAVTWIALMGCNEAGAGKSAGGSSKAAAAQALTDQISIRGGVKRSGGLPGVTAEDTSLDQTDDTITMTPDAPDPTLMSLSVDDPDGTPPEATLMQFSDAEDHIEVPYDSDAGTGDIEISMTVGAEVCEKLCNKEFLLELNQAVRLLGGGITKHLKREITLNCKDHGKKELCDDAPAEQDGGSGGSGGDGATSASRNLGTQLRGAIVGFSANLCTCLPDGMAAFCESGPLTGKNADCFRDFATNYGSDPATRDIINQCLIPKLNACGAIPGPANECDPTACGLELLSNHGCDAPPAEAHDAYLLCIPEAVDAGSPRM